jgi:hypothetical protein
MKTAIAGNVGVAGLALAVAFGLIDQWGWATTVLLLGVPWLTEPWHENRWVSTPTLFIYAGLAAVGVLLAASALLLLTGMVAGLVAWDLGHFRHSLRDVEDVRDEATLTQGHMWQLGLSAGLGWLLGAAALGLRLTFDFIGALILGILIIVALSGTVRLAGRKHVRPRAVPVNEQDDPSQ